MPSTRIDKRFAEFDNMVKKTGHFQVKTVYRGLQISLLSQNENDLSHFKRFSILNFIGSICVQLDHEFPFDDICRNLVTSYGYRFTLNEYSRSLLLSCAHTGDVYGVCATLSGSCIAAAKEEVYSSVVDVFADIIPKNFALEGVYSEFEKSGILFSYAELLRFVDDYPTALQVHQDALEIRRRVADVDEHDAIVQVALIDSYRCTGAVLCQLNRFKEAEELLTEAMNLCQHGSTSSKSSRHHTPSVQTAECALQLAEFFAHQDSDRYLHALEWYETAINELENLSADISTDMKVSKVRISSLAKYARCRKGIAMQKCAVNMLERGRCVVESALGDMTDSGMGLQGTHPWVLSVQRHRAVYEPVQNAARMDLDSTVTSAGVATGVSGAGGLRIADARRLFRDGRLGEALEMLCECEETITSEAEDIPEPGEALCDPGIADVLHLRGNILLVQGEIASAAECFEKSTHVNTTLNRVVPYAVENLVGIAACFQADCDFNTALKVYNKALTMLLKRSRHGGTRIPPEFRHTDVSNAENVSAYASVLLAMSSLLLTMGLVVDAERLQNEVDRLLDGISEEYKSMFEIKLADVQMNRARVLLATGRLAEASVTSAAVLAVYRDLFSSESVRGHGGHYKVADALLLYCEVEISCGRHESVGQVVVEALTIYKAVFTSKEHPSIVKALYLTGQLVAAAGRHSHTAGPYKQAITLCKKSETDTPLLACVYYSLAESLRSTGDYSAAIENFQHALKIQEDTLGKQHWQYVASVCGLASVKRLQGNFEEATQLCDNAWKLRSNVSEQIATLLKFKELQHIGLGTNPGDEDNGGERRMIPVDALCLLERAECHRTLAEHDQAADLYDKALAIRKRVYSNKHPSVIEVIQCQAENLRDLSGDEKSSYRLAKKAYFLCKNTLGEKSLEIALSMQTLGDMSAIRKDFDVARDYLEGCLPIIEEKLGKKSLRYASALNSLGRMYTLQNILDSASDVLEEALRLRVSLLGGDNFIEVGESLNNLGELHRLRHNITTAEAHLLRARNVFRSTLGSSHPKTINAEGNYGLVQLQVHSGGEERKKALENIEQCIESLTSNRGGKTSLPRGHYWVRKFEAALSEKAPLSGASSSQNVSNSITRPQLDDASSIPSWKLLKLKCDNEQLRAKNEEMTRTISSLQSKLRLLELRLHNMEQLNEQSTHMISALKGDCADHSEDTSCESLPKLGSITSSLGYGRKLAKGYKKYGRN
mmetsp:Transcript_26223/g.38857  ORF Transcript_26223/g.38857 Transcript_26223/m.38857 type:complete len:1230 (-) Transcript_26223:178-3867(-)|eukprot:CAMPEP_0185041324 /NCGR_PEP_ID=MMETSP1103-20130426/40458_1 /TAXON_ID=36769 /ORGANISM="Paraphysomonas bandaiensis, Strain Caron Lab Isolate" /LENGTH=1229 /DNA_ID=CAMNT_0027580995 /DNA_START=172 /DNA_END=3861 /DNA_ORIENTATION=-